MLRTKLLLIGLLCILPISVSAASFAIPFNGTTTTGTIISVPTPVNGIKPIIQSPIFIASSTTATSTFANGLTLTSGCFAVGTTCLTTGADTFAWPFTAVAGGNATSTLLYLYGGLYSIGSSTFSGTGNCLTVDSTTLIVDCTNHRVGVGNASPANTLDVTGTTHSTVGVVAGSGGLAAGMKFEARGGPFYQDETGVNAYLMNGTVNYGALANTTGDTWSLGYTGVANTIETPVLTWTSGGRVGIGTTTPAAPLDVYVANVSGKALSVEGTTMLNNATSAPNMVIPGDAAAIVGKNKSIYGVNNSNDTVEQMIGFKSTTGVVEIDRNAVGVTLGAGITAVGDSSFKSNTTSGQTTFINYDTGNSNRVLYNFYNTSNRAVADMNDAAAATQIHLDTGGVSYFNGGNVGIGTTTVTFPITIQNTNTNANAFVQTRATNSAGFGIVGLQTLNGVGLSNSETTTIAPVVRAAFATNGGEVLGSYATNPYDPPANGLIFAGNLGVGVTVPKSPIHVTTSAAVVGALTSSGMQIDSRGNTNDISQITYGYTGNGASANNAPAATGFITTTSSGDTFGDLYFATRNVTTDTAPTTRFTITSAGNVGAGTTSPGTLFSIGNTQGWNFGTGTTTANSTGGINLANGGCFSISGTCISGSGGGGSGTVNSSILGNLAYYGASGTTVSGTTTFPLTVGSLIATSTTATSTFGYGVNLPSGGCYAVGGNCITTGGAAILSAVRIYKASAPGGGGSSVVNATWTAPANLAYVQVQVYGGGGGAGTTTGSGGGGGGGSSCFSTICAGGGGGSGMGTAATNDPGGGGGGYASDVLSAATVGTSQSVYVGAGGYSATTTTGAVGGSGFFGGGIGGAGNGTNGGGGGGGAGSAAVGGAGSTQTPGAGGSTGGGGGGGGTNGGGTIAGGAGGGANAGAGGTNNGSIGSGGGAVSGQGSTAASVTFGAQGKAGSLGSGSGGGASNNSSNGGGGGAGAGIGATIIGYGGGGQAVNGGSSGGASGGGAGGTIISNNTNYGGAAGSGPYGGGGTGPQDGASGAVIVYEYTYAGTVTNGVVISGTTGQIPYYAGSGTTLTATSSLFITTSGNIGIGTTTPNWLLQQSGTRPFHVLSDSSAAANAKHWYEASEGGNFYIGTSSDLYATSTPYISILNGGRVIMPNLTTVTGGTNRPVCFIAATGELVDETTSVCQVSSLIYKKNISTLSVSALDMVNALRPVSYTMKEDVPYDYQNKQYGLIAEEVAKVDPHLAEYGADGKPRTLDDRGIMSVIVRAFQLFYSEFQSLVAKVAGLEGRLNTQQKQIDNLQAQINALKK